MQKRCIFVRAWVVFKRGKIVHNNWGDDLNFYFLHLISGKKIVFLPFGKIVNVVVNIVNCPYVLGIGSILSGCSLNNAMVIGSGILSNSVIDKIHGNPKKIYFLRGPISRKLLAEKNIDAPELYGDLAMALPLYYRPNIQKSNKLGIVLHYVDEKLDSVSCIKNNFPSVKFIYMRGYNKWTDVIDAILSCEVILSSSLHGLICAEAYKVCCQWIYFSDRKGISDTWPDGWKLKFYDFFASLGKESMEPMDISQNTNLAEIADRVHKEYVPSDFDSEKLIAALPSEFVVQGGGLDSSRNYPRHSVRIDRAFAFSRHRLSLLEAC